ncbi:unnamed protein product, partial [Dibothriocephalus latus]
MALEALPPQLSCFCQLVGLPSFCGPGTRAGQDSARSGSLLPPTNAHPVSFLDCLNVSSPEGGDFNRMQDLEDLPACSEDPRLPSLCNAPLFVPIGQAPYLASASLTVLYVALSSAGEEDPYRRKMVYNPSTEAVVAEVPALTSTEVNTAITFAAEAQRAWAAKTAGERASVIRRWADVLRAQTPLLAELITTENGKVDSDATGEIPSVIATLESHAEEASFLTPPPSFVLPACIAVLPHILSLSLSPVLLPFVPLHGFLFKFHIPYFPISRNLMGKVDSDARGEIASAIAGLEWYAEEAKRTYGCIIPSTSIPNRRLLVNHQPVGVVAMITP